MRLAEKPMPRSYHALDHDWTPLSRNPCWLSNAFHCLRDYVKRNRPSLISSADTFAKESFSNHKLHCAGDKSIADDFGASRYCKCESSLCATIHWGFSCVPTICSSLNCLSLCFIWISFCQLIRMIRCCYPGTSKDSATELLSSFCNDPTRVSLQKFSFFFSRLKNFRFPYRLRLSSIASGHTMTNTPDLFRTPKLTVIGPGQYWGGGPPGKSLGCC